jgi:soluble lytic murein transglycosylase-like protein
MSWSAPAADDDLAQPRSGASASLRTADAIAQPGLLVPLLALAKLTAGLFVALLLIIFVVTLFTNDAAMTTGSQYRPSQLALQQIPPRYLRLYQAAAARYGLDWTILAAIGAIESGHGRDAGPSSAGALGPMQFMPDTWRRQGLDANGDGRRDINDPEDAIPSAAVYLRAAGAPANYRRAIFAYNHADWYVDQVLALADRYRGAPAEGRVAGGALQPPSVASVRDLLASPNLTLTRPASQRGDLARREIDRRIVAILQAIVRQHRITITALKSDHSLYTNNGTISNHAVGRAVDIAVVDGQPCDGSRIGSCGQLALELVRLTAAQRPTELIYAFDADGPGIDAFADPIDHSDHVHVGFDG